MSIIYGISLAMGIGQIYAVFVHAPVCLFMDWHNEKHNPKISRGF